MNIGEMDLVGYRVSPKAKDFSGRKGYGSEFSVIVEDPEAQKVLESWGVNLAYSKFQVEGEPPKAYMNIKLDFRYGDVHVVCIDAEGNGTVLNQDTIGFLDRAWVRKVDAHVIFNKWNQRGRTGVTCYAKVLAVWLLSDEEREQISANATPNNAVYNKYSNYFKK